MQSLIPYFLKVNVVLSLLFLLYWLLLRKEKFFVLNRFLLLSIIAFAFVLPLLPAGNVENKLVRNIQDRMSKVELLRSFQSPEQQYPETERNESLLNSKQRNTSNGFSIVQVLTSIYLLISIVFFARLFVQFVQLFRLLRGNETKSIDGIVLHTTEKPLPPFSFFRHLVICKSQFGAEQIEQIVAHEKVHIKQWHMIDILLAELVQVLLWINPLVWVLNHCIKLNLEYIADEKVLNSGVDRRNYQVNILTSCLNPTEYQVANLFHSSQIKLRIKMMNTTHSPLSHIYKYVVILPALLGAYLIINPASAQKAATSSGPNNAIERNEEYKSPDAVYIVINADTDEKLLKGMAGSLKKFGVDFSVGDHSYNYNGKLTKATVEVGVSGINYKANLSAGNGKEPLLKEIIFYYEPGGKGVGLTDAGIPEGLTRRGKLVVTNNLNGFVAFYEGEKMAQSGTIYTTWKKR